MGADGALGLLGVVLSGGQFQREHLLHVCRGWKENKRQTAAGLI